MYLMSAILYNYITLSTSMKVTDEIATLKKMKGDNSTRKQWGVIILAHFPQS